MNFKTLRTFKHAVVKQPVDQNETLIVEATSNYIPFEQFKEIFNGIGEEVEKLKSNKLVFDKTKLTVFHQPSMEWYFTDWKEKMFDLGLKKHRKILPQDDVFRQSVRIGREKINKMYPNGKFKEMDIQYAESIQEAISK